MIQEKLVEKGFKPGPTDGVVGPKTLQAIEEFKRERDLENPRVLDKETIDLLKKGDR